MVKMNTNTKNSGNLTTYLVIGALLVAVLWLGFSGSNNPESSQVGEGKFTAIGYNSAVCKEVIRADGTKENLGCKHNLFTNLGKNITRDLLGKYSSLAAVTAIGVGNLTGTTQAATDVVLAGEYG